MLVRRTLAQSEPHQHLARGTHHSTILHLAIRAPQLLCQPPAAAPKEVVNTGSGKPKQPGRLLRAATLQVKRMDCQALPLGQPGQVAQNELLLLGGLQLFFCPGSGPLPSRGAADEFVPVAPQASSFFPAHLPRDADDPCPEAFAVAQSAQLLMRPQERLLAEILGHCVVGKGVVYDGSHQARVPIIKPAERLPITAERFGHQARIGFLSA